MALANWPLTFRATTGPFSVALWELAPAGYLCPKSELARWPQSKPLVTLPHSLSLPLSPPGSSLLAFMAFSILTFTHDPLPLIPRFLSQPDSHPSRALPKTLFQAGWSKLQQCFSDISVVGLARAGGFHPEDSVWDYTTQNR